MVDVLQHGPQELGVGVAPEGLLPRQGLGQHDPDREDIRALIDVTAHELFRRHVAECAHDDALGGAGAGHHRLPGANLGQAEIEDLHHDEPRVLPPADHVLGLEVAMDDALRVCGRGAAQQRIEPLRGRRWRHRSQALELRAEGHPVDALHHEVRSLPIERTDVVHADDVRMAQPRRRARLAVKTTKRPTLAKGARQDDLDRDGPAEPQVPCFVHRSHAALSDELIEPVLSVDRAPDGHRQGQEHPVAVAALGGAVEAGAADGALLQ